MKKKKFEECFNRITKGDSLSKEELSEMMSYKVDNAIIMAAGLSSRCLPLSRILPKGLFVVKGEVLIEREIRQLKEAGINEIIVVTGYMSEKFEYLKDKYDVILVHNPEYNTRNNTSSLFAARNYIGNSYICCADNYFVINPFHEYCYDSYYTCKYSDEFIDEFCLTNIDKNGYITEITRGGKGYYTMGAVYFCRSFSEKFIKYLSTEYDREDVKGMLIDTFHIIHMNELPSTYELFDNKNIYEFDTLKEIMEFDPDFEDYYCQMMENNLFERYQNIDRYSGVATDQITGRLHYNENLWGPSPKCIDTLYKTRVEDLYLYDSNEDDDLIESLAKHLSIDKECIFLHNGSAEIIKTIFSVMLEKGDSVLLPEPGWSYYLGVVEYKFCNPLFYHVNEGITKCYHNVPEILQIALSNNPKIIVITSPAMPSGNRISASELEEIIKKNPGALILVDEAYYGFCEYDYDIDYLITTYDNVIFSRTFSKYYALANLRIGYGICSKKAKHVLWLDLPLHRLSHITKRMAIAALEDTAYYACITKEAQDSREWFRKKLNEIDGVKAFESDSNFLYIALDGYDVTKVKEEMSQSGYLIRVFEDYGSDHLRITIAPREILDDCYNKLKQALSLSKI